MSHILFIDDTLELNFSYLNVLKKSNKYSVDFAETPEEALPFLRRKNPPKCIILDIDMPIPDVVEEPLRSCWRNLGEPENSYGLVIAQWVNEYSSSIDIIILSSVPARVDKYKDEFDGFIVLDRLSHTPDDLLSSLVELID